MKRIRFLSGILCIAAILIAAAAGTGCGAAASKPVFTGKWLFSAMKSDGEELTAAQLGSMEVVTLEITSDGKAKLGGDGESFTGTWTEKNGTITITDAENGLTDTGTLTDADTLELKNGADTIVLVREGSAAAKKVASGITASTGGSESIGKSTDSSTAAAGTGTSSAASVPDSTKTESSSASSAASGGTSLTVEQSEIFSQEGVSVKVTGFAAADYYGPSLQIQIVNSSDQDLAVQVSDSSVNGYMISDQLWEEVAAGKKANAQIYMPTAYLQDAGIDTIAEMEFRLSLVKPDDYTNILTSDPITVKTSAYGSYTQPDKDGGTEVYSQDGVRIVSLGYGQDAFMNQAVMIYAENKTDKPIEVSIEKTSVDDTMTDATLYMDILPGKKAVSGITFYETLTDPGELECVFTVEDMSNYEMIGKSEAVKISMK